MKINKNLLELITPNPEEVVEPPVEKPTPKPLTTPNPRKFSFFGFRRRTKDEIAMDQIQNIRKYVQENTHEMNEEFKELQEEMKETEEFVKDSVCKSNKSSLNILQDCKPVLVELVRMDTVLDDVRTWHHATTSSL